MKNSLIFTFIKKHKISYAIGITLIISASYIQSLFPKVLGNIFDILESSSFEDSKVIINIIYLLLIALGVFLISYMWRYIIMTNARKFECSLREKLYTHFQKLSPEFYDKYKTGDLMAYAINDIAAARMSLGFAIAMGINSIITCAFSIYLMCTIMNWKITLVVISPLFFTLIFTLKIGNLIQVRFKKVQQSFANISDRVQENIYGIRVIKAYAQEYDEIDNFEILNQDMMEKNIQMVKTSSYLIPVIEICFSISFLINLIWGGSLVLNNAISLGSFIAFNGYITMIMNPILSFGRITNIVQRGTASLKRLKKILNEKPKIVANKRITQNKIKGNIELRNLNFSYNGEANNVLNNININISQGSIVGIVGKTGSGKSTLMNLLLKFYNVEQGKIFIDGRDINEYSLETLREAIGYVPQDNMLFSGTIKDNISFFKDQYSEIDIIKAAKASCIMDNILKFPDGFDTKLGERGINLSGGQKQRICIARALIKDSPILIFDDALSAVDTITEGQIIENLNSIKENKTIIIVAHRISVLKEADNIILMDDGEIVECGNHNELLNRRGKYYELYLEQCTKGKKKFKSL